MDDLVDWWWFGFTFQSKIFMIWRGVILFICSHDTSFGKCCITCISECSCIAYLVLHCVTSFGVGLYSFGVMTHLESCYITSISIRVVLYCILEVVLHYIIWSGAILFILSDDTSLGIMLHYMYIKQTGADKHLELYPFIFS